jgi:hypothetical protein
LLLLSGVHAIMALTLTQGWWCSDSFTPDEVELLRSVLLKKFGIESTRISNGMGKNQDRIRIANLDGFISGPG